MHPRGAGTRCNEWQRESAVCNVYVYMYVCFMYCVSNGLAQFCRTCRLHRNTHNRLHRERWCRVCFQRFLLLLHSLSNSDKTRRMANRFLMMKERGHTYSIHTPAHSYRRVRKNAAAWINRTLRSVVVLLSIRLKGEGYDILHQRSRVSLE